MRSRWVFKASSFRRVVMEVVMGGCAHNVLGGYTVSSISSSGYSHQCISRSIQMSREGERRSECQG
jgi:hypothetical protein